MRTRFHWLTEIKAPVTWLAAAFFISRLYASLAGVTFYSTFVHRLWQAIDIELLQTRFWESMLYAHAQPPVFNVVNGILVNLFPDRYATVFHRLNIALSLATVMLLHMTLNRLAVARWMNVVMCLLLIFNPPVIAYENLYSYTTLTIFLVMALTSATVCMFLTGEKRNYAAFVAALSLLVLTRSSFHLLWMIVMIAIATGLLKQRSFSRRVAIGIAVAGVVVTGSWYVKNYCLFGQFTASTWMGMNLARVLPPSTDLGRVGTFRSLESYTGYYEEIKGFDDVPLLNNPVKLRHPYPNYYHKNYIAVSDVFENDFLNEVGHHPNKYLEKVGSSLSIFFSPATHAPFIETSLERLEPFTTIFAFDYSRPKAYSAMQRDLDDGAATKAFMERNKLGATYAIPAVTVLVLLLIGLALLFRQSRIAHVEFALGLTLLLVYAYGVLVGIMFEFGENNRFRLELQPVMYVLIPFAVSRLWNKTKRGNAF